MPVKNKDATPAGNGPESGCQDRNEAAISTRHQLDPKLHLDNSWLSRFWLFYFMITIGLIGLFGAYLMSVPIYLFGRITHLLHPRAGKFVTAQADHVLQSGIYFLMMVQPWFNAKVDMKLNDNTKDRLFLKAAKMPGEGRLLVSNHRSHLDAFFLLSRVRGIRIFAKKSLFKIPFLGMMMRMSRQIPVTREINAFFEAMNHVRDRLRAGDTVHIFPEMTRCAPGFEGTRNFSALPFLIAIQERVSVIPIVFHSTDSVWPKGYLGLKFRRPVVARALEPILAEHFGSAEELRSEVRRRINEALSVPISTSFCSSSVGGRVAEATETSVVKQPRDFS